MLICPLVVERPTPDHSDAGHPLRSRGDPRPVDVSRTVATRQPSRLSLPHAEGRDGYDVDAVRIVVGCPNLSHPRGLFQTLLYLSLSLYREKVGKVGTVGTVPMGTAS